jgi:hypothetical protein
LNSGKRGVGSVISVVATLTIFAWLCCEPTPAVGVNHGIQQDDQKARQTPSAKPANSWMNLVPLRSSRADVERRFGKPQLMIGWRPLYKFQHENVVFTYARGNCDPYDEHWNVPAGTILEIEVVPQVTLRVADTGFDLTKFNQMEVYHPPQVVHTNVEEGITITTRTLEVAEEILSIELKPSVRELKFACPEKGHKP